MQGRSNVHARSLPIVKVNGAKNDFVLIDERPPRLDDYAAAARALCARGGAVGADGLLVVLAAPRGAEFAAALRVFNADGSEAEMCGNGVRCVARYLWERGGLAHAFAIATLGGPIGVRVDPTDTTRVRVDLGLPEIVDPRRTPITIEDGTALWRFARVSVPNPHLVAFVPDVAQVDLERLAGLVARDGRFRGGTNVHVAQVVGPAALRARHFERGVGLTQACGTGAVAVAVAAIDDGRVMAPATVAVPGGELLVDWQSGGHAYLEGPTVVEFARTVDL